MVGANAHVFWKPGCSPECEPVHTLETLRQRFGMQGEPLLPAGTELAAIKGRANFGAARRK